jgi:nitrogen fixation protein FixH
VFVVNGIMANYAVKTFSGLESPTPYKDGLVYNTELEAARRQEALGWVVDAHVALGGDDVAHVELQGQVHGEPLSGLAGHARLEHPADRRLDREADLATVGAGRWQADVAGVVPGQWDLVVTLERDGQRMFLSRNRIVLH